MSRHSVNIVGLGYVGTAMALHLASLGCSVTGTDVDPSRVHDLKNQRLPFPEQDLNACFQTIDRSLLRFVNSMADLERADLDPAPGLYFIELVILELRMFVEAAFR